MPTAMSLPLLILNPPRQVVNWAMFAPATNHQQLS
jgi:hypothetical protein